MSNTSGQILVLRDELRAAWNGQDVFQLVQNLSGAVAREVPGRQTLRFELNGQAYYRKLHTGVGWGEIVKNLVRGRLPVIGARNEWQALNCLQAAGVPSLTPVAYGEMGINPARRLSFIVTKELAGVVQLDDFLRAHPKLDVVRKRRLIDAVAKIARGIHQQGLNHRDLYLCHFMLDVSAFNNEQTGSSLYLVDLHRAQLRNKVPFRWVVKDLASIYFSAMDLGVTQKDICRFLRIYFAQPLKQVLLEQRTLLQAIVKRAEQLYQREQRLIARGEC
ncbi:lipopolysaccharide core heptose(I) kinase RfaP [Cellvibrio sp. NN19]|uniref:lipopolysaccharide core heptose(I) kinase RfaP n=1 Tax=Cellvibrio chitinivorans TaxID=3102792 RepID=UPI002B40D630|nr:lipopolysaccharide core heptose(I) kinase RfaP [Cellvibrio sp. NN19]